MKLVFVLADRGRLSTEEQAKEVKRGDWGGEVTEVGLGGGGDIGILVSMTEALIRLVMLLRLAGLGVEVGVSLLKESHLRAGR